MLKFKTTQTITYNDINEICKKYGTENIMIIIPNTKMQTSSEMRKIASKYPNIRFSVTGGLDPSKKKFKDEYYQSRTYYSASELEKIIAVYKGIERKIDLSWSETEKAMFVYKELCEKMEYSECEIGGRNYANGIGGLLHNKAVCAGIAMIFKEAMDRLGIECHYQNKKSHHCWNIVKLDGHYRGIDLTWDIVEKSKEGCTFKHFCRNGQKEFYSNKHHDISGENEESEFPIEEYSLQELSNILCNISRPRKLTLSTSRAPEGFEQTQVISANGIPCRIRKSKSGDISVKTENPNEKIDSKAFRRSDGSHFLLILSKESTEDLNKYVIIETDKNGVKLNKIYSESNLLTLPPQESQTIADGLLGSERLERKINGFNGYVGYIGANHGIYYSRAFEENTLNIYREGRT